MATPVPIRNRAGTAHARVAVFSTLAGLTYGAWVDGAALPFLLLLVGGFFVLLVVVLNVFEHRSRARTA